MGYPNPWPAPGADGMHGSLGSGHRHEGSPSHGDRSGYRYAGIPSHRDRSERQSLMSSYANQVESLIEREHNEQHGRTRLPSLSPRRHQESMSTAQLPAGGEYDEALLRPGGSWRLLGHLAEIFKGDPPGDAGRQPNAMGTFHGFKGNYGRKVFSPDAVVQTLRLAERFWGKAQNVIEVVVHSRARLVIVGDTHGQLEDVLWIFFKYGPPSKTNQYLFDGDIVDRGGHALEILLILLALKRDEPQCVHIVRGNHEDATTCSSFGFYAEIESKFGMGGASGGVLSACVRKVFPALPLGALVTDSAGHFRLCVLHGGVPVNYPGCRGPLTFGTLMAVNRFVTSAQKKEFDAFSVEDHIVFNVLWADPAKPGQDPNKDTGRGRLFTERDTRDFCSANRLNCVVRAHQPPDGGRGYQYEHGNHCITVFSASNYCGNLGNMGGVLVCDGDTLSREGPQPAEHMAPAWPKLVEVFRAHGLLDAAMPTRAQVAQQVEGGTPPPQASMPALQQVEHFVVQQIVKHKQKLFWELSRLDRHGTGMMYARDLAEVMGSLMTDVPPVWADLMQEWDVKDPVQYVRFLNRFQIISDLKDSKSMTQVDVLSVMSQLQVKISDVHVDKLLCSLDRDLNGSVDFQEFQHFLREWDINIPQWQSAALYEALIVSLHRSPRVEDVLLGMALMSQNLDHSMSETKWYASARVLGDEITRSGTSFVKFFKMCDTDGSGFLSAGELEQGLRRYFPNLGPRLSSKDLQGLVQHMDSQGQQNSRISLIEFLRSVGPSSLAKDLAGTFLGEVLKPVFFYKNVLQNLCQRFDSHASTVVSVDDFKVALEEINRQLSIEGGLTLSNYQLQAICEIASGGSGGKVQYRSFLGSLKVIDTAKRSKLSKLGLGFARALFSAKSPLLSH